MPTDAPILVQDSAAEAVPALAAHELEALRRLTVAACSTVAPDEVFHEVCVSARALLGADFVSASLRAFDGRRQWCADAEPEAEVAARLPTLLSAVREVGEPLVVGAADDAGVPAERVRPPSAGMGSAVVVPLRCRGELLGALLVGWERRGASTAAALRLAAEVAEAAAVAFQNAARYDEMRQAAIRRDRFFSAMSHDLRTPITAIVGYSELLQDGIFGEMTEKQQEMVERISQVSGHLSQLLNDVMDLAKLDAGRMEFHLERVALGDLVEEAIVTVEPQAHAKGLEIRLDLGGHGAEELRVDPPRVRQILINLLSNAVKFTERGTVLLAAGVAEGSTWLEVRDTGPGLPAGSEEAIFEEFLQLAAGNKAKRDPGSGLGLAISRRLARAMGGDLVARSVPGSGASFTLYLPRQDG